MSARRLVMVFNGSEFIVLHRAAVVRGLRAAGFEVHLVTPGAEHNQELRRLSPHVHAWELSRRSVSPATEAAVIARLAMLYRELRPNFVYHETIKPVIYGSVAARLAPTTHVVNAVSGMGSAFLSAGLRAALVRRVVTAGFRVALAGRDRTLLVQNRDDERELRAAGVVGEHTDVRNFGGAGVDLVRFRGAPEREGVVRVLLPARMLADKGVREFVEASRLLRARGVVCTMTLVGGVDPGNPTGIPQEQLERWNTEGVVEWLGPQHDMPAVLRDSHIVCLPSYREGIPKVLMEAGAVGRAVVTTDVPGCRDVVAGGKLGVLVPPRDPAALAEALAPLIRDAAYRTEWANRLHQHALAHFDEADVVRKYVALFEEVARRTPAR